jgi:trans-4-hydroxy-L-proline dehydratase
MNGKNTLLGDTEIPVLSRGSLDAPVLAPGLVPLREAALADAAGSRAVAVMPAIDAEAWRLHDDAEDWLLWRARRVAARLTHMPLAVSAGELVVGRPDFGPARPEDRQRITDAKATLALIPPYPGGDNGHFNPDFDKLFRVGIGGIRGEIAERLAAERDPEKRTFYRACAVAMEGFAAYVRNAARACAGLPGGAALSAMVERLADAPPATLHEAVQLLFLTLVAAWYGEDHGLTPPGRLDRTLRRFHDADRAAGRCSVEQAFDLICCLYIQCNRITANALALSVIVGGRDADGADLTNDLSYLCCAARSATRLAYPTVGIAWHEGTPPALTAYACRMISTGIGDPAFFNDELIAQGLRDHGVSAEDSFDYMNSTCVEIKVVGASNMWVTAPYFNCPQALLDVMDDVVMDRAADGGAVPPADFSGLKDMVKARLAETVAAEAARLDAVWRQREKTGCAPLASCLIKDCLERGRDFDRGGARYNWVENSFVGLANLTDSLVAVKRLVYDTREYSLTGLRGVLRNDFQGNEVLRARIRSQFPCYGTDDPEADAIAKEMAEFLEETTAANTVGLHAYVPGFFCWVMHGEFGSRTGTTPDGRRSGFPLADGAGAAQGRERKGPTASILSTTKWDHRKAIGGLVHNVKFSKSSLRTDEDMSALANLITTYMRRGGFEIQVNVVDAATLREAQARPEEYQDLIVRVAGYSDYFVRLSGIMQEEVIQRTEHCL